MDDARIWEFEESLWKASAERYHDRIAADALFVVPAQPHILTGEQAADAMAQTPRWDSVTFSERRVSRPQEGWIVIAYRADAERGEERYCAWATTTMQRLGHDDWVVVQHQQTPPLVMD